ncbi:RNA-directed DNA polymerase, eukaryota, reverse transcriptase zinc-binding domain protein [Tanacetum coccineum]
MRELMEDTFSRNKNDDAHEHIERVLDIVSLFNIPEVTHDAVMLRVFPITLIGASKRYCPPSKTVKQLEDIRHFKQEGEETLYQAWESNNSEGMAAIVSKLDNLGLDMKKLKENVHAIQVGCQLCGGPHLDKECPLNKESKSMKEIKYGEDLTKEVHAKAATEVPTSSVGQCKAVYDDAPINNASSNETNEIHGVSFINEQEDDDLLSEGLPCQLLPKEINPGSFTLPCNIVEMADMTKKAPLGIVENILVKIDKFLFSLDFIAIDILKTSNETMILGRPFLETIHAEIDVFNKEISLGIINDKIIFDMNKKNYKFTTPIEKAYMVNVVHSKDLMDIDCDLFLYESESREFNRLLAIDLDIFTCDIDIQESYKEIVYRYGKVCNITRDRILKDHWKERFGEEDDNTDEGWEDPEKYGEKKID